MSPKLLRDWLCGSYLDLPIVLETDSCWRNMVIVVRTIPGAQVDFLTLSVAPRELATDKEGLEDGIRVHPVNCRSVPKPWKFPFTALR
jgi:hypothetical protein